MATGLKELQSEFKAKQARLNDIFDAKPDMDFNLDELSDIQQKNKELNDLGSQIDQFKNLDRIREENERRNRGELVGLPLSGGQQAPSVEAAQRIMTLGKQYIGSDGFKSWNGAARKTTKLASLNAKTLFAVTSTNSASVSQGFVPEVTRIPGFVVDYRLRTPVMADLIPQGTTNQPGVKYILQSPQTNGSTYVYEADPTLGESAFAYTEQYAVVQKLRTTIPITDEAMEDAEMLSDIIDTQLMWMLALKRDLALLKGSGTAPEILGIMNTSGIQTQAKSSDPTPDAFYKAIVNVQLANFLEPDHIVMHPRDWQNIRLLRTPDGLYIYGSPLDPSPDRMWGLPVTKTVAMTQGTALVGAFANSCMEFMRKEVTLEASTEHDLNFIKGILTLKAELRHVLVVYRPAGFCQVTNI